MSGILGPALGFSGSFPKFLKLRPRASSTHPWTLGRPLPDSRASPSDSRDPSPARETPPQAQSLLTERLGPRLHVARPRDIAERLGAGLPPLGAQQPRHPRAPGWDRRRGATDPPRPCDQGVRVDRNPLPAPRPFLSGPRPHRGSSFRSAARSCRTRPAASPMPARSFSPAARPVSFKLPASPLYARATQPLGSGHCIRLPHGGPSQAEPRRTRAYVGFGELQCSLLRLAICRAWGRG